MLLLRGAAGMAWLLAVEPVIKAAASAAITRLVFIAYLLFVVVVGGDLLEKTLARVPSCATRPGGAGLFTGRGKVAQGDGTPAPSRPIEDSPGTVFNLSAACATMVARNMRGVSAAHLPGVPQAARSGRRCADGTVSDLSSLRRNLKRVTPSGSCNGSSNYHTRIG